MTTPQELADTLVRITPGEYARFVAQGLTDATDLAVTAQLTSDRVIDALVTAATDHVSFSRTNTIPTGTKEPRQSLDTL